MGNHQAGLLISFIIWVGNDAVDSRQFSHFLGLGPRYSFAIEGADQDAETYDDLVKASQDVARDGVEAIQAAKNKFDRTVKDVPDDATLTQAVNSLRDEAANVQAAVSDLQTAAKC